MQSPSARVLEELLHGKTVAADDNKSFRCVLAAENDLICIKRNQVVVAVPSGDAAHVKFNVPLLFNLIYSTLYLKFNTRQKCAREGTT